MLFGAYLEIRLIRSIRNCFMSDFIHLHVHTEYSLLDGLSKITELVAKAKEYEMKACAITDHGVMYGVIPFYLECLKQKIKPIIGCEIYMAHKSRLDKQPKLTLTNITFFFWQKILLAIKI